MPCIIYFSGDAKLGRSNKLGASKILILVEINLTEAFSAVNSSNLILSNFSAMWYNMKTKSLQKTLFYYY